MLTNYQRKEAWLCSDEEYDPSPEDFSTDGRSNRRNCLFFHANGESGFAKYVGTVGKEREVSLNDHVTEALLLELVTL